MRCTKIRIYASTRRHAKDRLKVSIRIYGMGGAIMPKQILKRLGNSLAVRIPANTAAKVSLEEGQDVCVEVENGRVVMRPHEAIRRFSRERLIQQYREGKLAAHGELDFGDPVGSEWSGPDGASREGIK
ncbi:hypothetical protein BRCH_00845c [Candidatus Burkholderia brachyanthoides]|nr:hypothetical protein BRCH_00845c [Candidatus Burkholderia brachyanthoides]